MCERFINDECLILNNYWIWLRLLTEGNKPIRRQILSTMFRKQQINEGTFFERKTEVKRRSPTDVKPRTVFLLGLSRQKISKTLLCLRAYLHLLLLFSKVIFMFHSIWKSSNLMNFEKLRKNAHLTKSKCWRSCVKKFKKFKQRELQPRWVKQNMTSQDVKITQQIN